MEKFSEEEIRLCRAAAGAAIKEIAGADAPPEAKMRAATKVGELFAGIVAGGTTEKDTASEGEWIAKEIRDRKEREPDELKELLVKWINQVGKVEKALADLDQLPDKKGAVSEMRAILNQVAGSMVAAEDKLGGGEAR